MIKKFENALNKIPRVRAEVGVEVGATSGEMQDCCPPGDPKADPISNGKLKAETKVELKATIRGKVWGPPLIYFQADFKVVIAEFVLDVGVNIVASPSVSGSYGVERNACLDQNCAFFEFAVNLAIGLEARIEATAEACVGWGAWAACGGFDFEARPAAVIANFKGFTKIDSCNGVTGDIGLDKIEFVADIKAFGVTVAYKYQIYP
jgi:hypothetical protein